MTCDPNTAPRATGPGWQLRQGRWQDALSDVESVDALIVDAPYSERTHESQVRVNTLRDPRKAPKPINYACWSADDVRAFVDSWAPRTRGWFVTITDHNLAPEWDAALSAHGRYTFSPLAFVAPGSRVRLGGDGPSQWSCWIVVARPASLSTWGTLPGAYVLPSGIGDGDRAKQVVGGKPLWLMRALVSDYTRPGDLVVDPCAGGGTTLLAAVMEGRRAIGAELDPKHYDIARKRLERGFTVPMFAESAGSVAVQQSLLGDDE